jgi:hypothetical protein
MESRVLKTSAGTFIFLILVITVIALVKPVYSRLAAVASAKEESFALQLRQKTGLSVSYESLSPSILSSINIKGIVVTDTSTGKKLLEVRRASLSYKAGKSITSLLLNGVTAEFDAVSDAGLQRKIASLISNLRGTDKTDNADAQKDASELAVQNILSIKNLHLSFDVLLKNVSLRYSDSDNDVTVLLKKASFRESDFHDSISAGVSGNITYSSRYIKTGTNRAVCASAFSFTGSIFPDLDGSSASLRLSGLNSADYTLTKMDFLINYVDSKFSLRTVRSIWPAFLIVQADMKKGEANLSASADSFNPFMLFKIRQQNDVIAALNGMRITGTISAAAVFAPKNGAKKSLSYSAGGSVSLPKKTAGSPLNISCTLDGTLKKINLEKISVSGEKLGAEFSGSYDIAKKQPSGTLSLDHYVLANGGVISTEVYIEPQNAGFMCFSPQLFLGERAFTALQLTVLPVRNSIDFSFEADDYSHADYETPGHIKIDGSFLTGKAPYLQAGIVISDEFMDSAAQAAAFFMPEDKSSLLRSNSSTLAPFICSDEMYVSTDFKQISFNAPYCVIANTKKDKQLLVFGVDGSNQTVQLSRFDLILGSQTVHASAQVDFLAASNDAVFSGDFSVNAIPYRFNGNYSQGWIGVTGDYGLDAALSFGGAHGKNTGGDITGSLRFNSLPLTLGSTVVTLTTDTALSWTKHDGLLLNIIGFEAEEPTGHLAFRPKITLSGTANKYGIEFDSIAYTDNVSVLNGSASIVWNYSGILFDSAHAMLSVASPITKERFDFAGDLTNPTHAGLSFSSLMNDIYFSSTADIESSPISRFVSDQSIDDTLTASLSASGTLSNPFISVTVQNMSMALIGSPLIGHGTFVMDDNGISTRDVSISWMDFSVSEINALFHPENFTGDASAVFNGKVAGQTVHAPFTITVSSPDEEKHGIFPDDFTAVLNAPEISGDLFDKPVPFKLTMSRAPGLITVFSGTGTGITALLADDGNITVRTGESVPFVFTVDGSVTRSSLDLSVKNVDADLAKISQLVDIPNISFSNGELKGSCRITGILTDPEFAGAFTVTNFDLDAPDFLQDSLRSDRILIAVEQGGLSIPDTMFRTGKGQVLFGLNMSFDRWKIDSTNIRLKTPENSFVPIDLKVPFVHYKGDSSMNLNIGLSSDVMEFDGSVLAQNGIFEVVTSSLQSTFAGENLSASVPSMDMLSSVEKIGSMQSVKVQLDVMFGQHVQIQFNPLMRGIVVPNTPVSFFYDSEADILSLKGNVELRGGEIAWLNRNFYMKDGRIQFNETMNNVDPRLTVRAETRERDDEGNQVRIILSAINQPISKFTPQLSASPAKSELEIMELLGQIVTADSNSVSSFVMAGGDYLVQATVMRQVENALRELCNFDIFSVRTMVLQNALKQGLNLNSGSNKLTVGNFFDNSTVYIGKYFGSSLYVDALMHWSYDESKLNDSTSVGGLVFQPEFGLEMASPFATIRWGIAPDIEAIQNNMWVPSTSITLSWKFTF